jgi:hypothetical protein
MVRPGGKADQLVSNVAPAGARVCMRGARCRPTAVGCREARARSEVEKAPAAGESVGAESGCDGESGVRAAAAAVEDMYGRGCRRSRVLRMGVLAGRAQKSWCWGASCGNCAGRWVDGK